MVEKYNKDFFKHRGKPKIFEKFEITNKPMTVISAGIHSEYKPEFKKIIIELQKNLVQKSTNGRQVVAEKSNHNVPFVQPEVIVDAVREMIANIKI